MTTPTHEAGVLAVLARAQDEGALGARPVDEVLAHARSFVAALPSGVSTVLDMGTGAGVPGLVIALDRPEICVVMVDRRAKRVDSLQRAIVSLGWSDRVQAIEADADLLSRDPQHHHTYDAVVARGFAEPLVALPIAVRLTRPGGWVIISEPPPERGSRWDTEWVQTLGVAAPERLGSVVRFHVEQPGE